MQGDRAVDVPGAERHANQLGRALLARGLRREGVVAVVTERNLDWMAAVIAIFKAGGVLPARSSRTSRPIASRPRCPAPSARSCSPSRPAPATLDAALDIAARASRRSIIDDAYDEGHADADLGVAVHAGQLAYIYFTSGSTGEPKGAMCEHAGMLNHLYAKIDDLDDRRRARWSPRPRRSASTSRCGSWSRRCWSAAGRCWSSRR